MNRRLSELEKAALTELAGETTLRIQGTEGGIETPVPSVRLSQLQRDAFVLVDNEVAVRVTGDLGRSLTEVAFSATDKGDGVPFWAQPSPADGTSKITLTHDLNTTDLIVSWYETGSEGTVDVPWIVSGLGSIEGCVPVGAEFDGHIIILASAPTSTRTTSFKETFDINKWILQSNGTYIATFNHNLQVATITFELYSDDNCPIIICPSLETTTQIAFTTTHDFRFGGRLVVRG